MYASKIVQIVITNSFSIHSMNKCQCLILKEINVYVSILDNIFNCWQPHQSIHLKKKKKSQKKSIQKYTNAKNHFSEKKLPLIENLRVKSLDCLKH